MQNAISNIHRKRQALDEALAEAERQMKELQALPRSRESVEKAFLDDVAGRCTEFEARTHARIQSAARPDMKDVLDLLWNPRTREADEDALTYLHRPAVEQLIRAKVAAALPAGGISDTEREQRREELQTRVNDLTRQREALQAEIKGLAT